MEKSDDVITPAEHIAKYLENPDRGLHEVCMHGSKRHHEGQSEGVLRDRSAGNHPEHRKGQCVPFALLSLWWNFGKGDEEGVRRHGFLLEQPEEEWNNSSYVCG